MKLFKQKLQLVAVALTGSLALLTNHTAQAGGPLEVCQSGVPYLWPNGGQNVPFNPDQGALGILDSTAAVQAVTDAFQAWEDVSTASISYSNQGQLPVDVDVTNFAPFLQAAGPDGVSAIVFDDTGEIFDLLFGAGSGVLGFASPEFLDEPSCTVLEGYSFLNGPAISSLEGLLNLMVHEFGHYSNLAHTEVNGQIYGDSDNTGAGADNTTFGPAPSPLDPGFDLIETMYPFLFSDIDQVSRTPHADDIAALSRMYPDASFANTGTISGTILLGDSKLTGINVIARNLNDPFADAVSAISSDFTRDYSQGDTVTGTYTLTGLTPGEDYAIYVNGLLSGNDRFSTPGATLPGPEEYYNGANESGNGLTDLPGDLTPVTAVAGSPISGVDILFNLPVPGQPLNTGDDGNVAIPLPFEFCIAGEPYSVAYINGNGFITFGSADDAFGNFIEDEASFLSGPPRIAGFWDDLSPNIAGIVSYDATDHTFSVTWDGVPEYGITDGTSSNTFSIEIRDNSFLCTDSFPHHGYWANILRSEVKITHGEMTSTDGLVGVSSGIAATSQFETETDLSAASGYGIFGKVQLLTEAAQYELFSDPDVFDLANGKTKFIGVGLGYTDRYERSFGSHQRNNSLETASKIGLPFDSIDTFRDFTALAPSGEDIDFYLIDSPLDAGSTLVAEIVTGQIDSVMGLYHCKNLSVDDKRYGKHRGHHHRRKPRCDSEQAELVAFNDDSNGLLSKIQFEIPEDGYYAIAVSYFGDTDFDGEDPGQGAPFDGGRYVLDAFVIEGSILALGDEDASEIDLGFDFTFQGQSYDTVFVNSNGFLTFGSGAPNDFSPSVTTLELGAPRIAPLWADLDPSEAGIVVASLDNGSSKTISFLAVPRFSLFGGAGPNTFSVTLSADNSVSFAYESIASPSGLSGIAEGNGATATEVDLSAMASLSASDSIYELFSTSTNLFDLENSALQFTP